MSLLRKILMPKGGGGVLVAAPPPPPPEHYAGPFLIVEDVPYEVIFSTPYQRKTGYAGRYWVFYYDGTNIVYRSSADGETWTDATVLTSDITDCRDISVFFKDSYVHVVKTRGAVSLNQPILYRRGLASGDSITWEDWRTAVAAVSDKAFAYPSICVDSNGYPCISYIRFNDEANIFFCKATAIDGSAWESPTQMSPDDFGSGMRNTQVLPLSGGKLYYIYSPGGVTGKGKLFDGTSWGSEEEVTTVAVYGDELMACSEGDIVHLVYGRGTGNYPLYYRQRTSGGWQTEEEVFAGDGYAPNATISVALGDVYVFYDKDYDSYYDSLWLRRRVSGVWQAEEQPYGIVENIGGEALSAFFVYLDGKIGVVWQNHDGDWVYDLRYGICY